MPSSYISKIRQDFNQNSVNLGNKFRLTFPGNDNRMVYRLKAFEIPILGISTADYRPYGGGLLKKVPYGDINMNFTVSLVFVLDKELYQLQWLRDRMKDISPNIDGVINYEADYKLPVVKVEIAGMDSVVYQEVIFHNCFFSSIEQIQFSTENTSPIEVNTMLAFEDMKINKGSGKSFDEEEEKGLLGALDDLLGDIEGAIGDAVGKLTGSVPKVPKPPF